VPAGAKPADVDVGVAEARAELQIAEIEVAQALETLNFTQSLVKKGFATAAQEKQAEAKLEVAKARLDLAQLKHRWAEGRPPKAEPPAPAVPAADLLNLELEVKLAEIELERAKAESDLAGQQLVRMKSIVGAQSELAMAQVQATKARFDVEAWTAKLDVARRRLALAKQTTPAAPPTAPTSSPELKKLREERLAAAREMLEVATTKLTLQRAEDDEVYIWSIRVRDAETDLDPADRAAAARRHLDRMKAQEARVEELTKAGVRDPKVRFPPLSAAKYYRVEAELAVKGATAAPPADGGRSNPFDPKRSSSAPAGFRGTVTKVDHPQRAGGDRLVTLEPGADAGLRPGMELRVTRLKPAPKHVGRIVIMEVLQKEAVGRFVAAAGAGGGTDDDPKVGDTVEAR
jgi:hypothetical protein